MLRERGVDFDTIEYLSAPPGSELLHVLLDALEVRPAELLRKDKNFAALGLDEDRYSETTHRADVIALLVEHPELMQRPIALCDGRAVIARPAERVLELIDR